jgi:hypothetical protein
MQPLTRQAIKNAPLGGRGREAECSTVLFGGLADLEAFRQRVLQQPLMHLVIREWREGAHAAGVLGDPEAVITLE